MYTSGLIRQVCMYVQVVSLDRCVCRYTSGLIRQVRMYILGCLPVAKLFPLPASQVEHSVLECTLNRAVYVLVRCIQHLCTYSVV